MELLLAKERGGLKHVFVNLMLNQTVVYFLNKMGSKNIKIVSS